MYYQDHGGFYEQSRRGLCGGAGRQRYADAAVIAYDDEPGGNVRRQHDAVSAGNNDDVRRRAHVLKTSSKSTAPVLKHAGAVRRLYERNLFIFTREHR